MATIVNPGRTPFEKGASDATASTGNSKADLFLAQSAMQAMQAENDKVAAAVAPVLAEVAAPLPVAEPQIPTVATVIDAEAKPAASLSSKVLSLAQKTVKVAVLTGVASTVVVLGASALAPAACATNVLAGGLVCEAVLPSAVAINTGLAAAGAGLVANATHVHGIGVMKAYKNYNEYGSVFAPPPPPPTPVVVEPVYYYAQEIAGTGLVLALAAAARFPEPAKQALTSTWNAAKDPVGTFQAAKEAVKAYAGVVVNPGDDE